MRLLVLPLLALAACSTHLPTGAAGPSPVAPGEPTVLAYGESKALGEDYQLSFVDVTQDSRCPSDVTCVWEGQAKVALGPSHPTMRFRPDTLLLRGGRPDSLTVGPFVVKATRLDPYPVSTAPIPREQYRLTFVVRRTR